MASIITLATGASIMASPLASSTYVREADQYRLRLQTKPPSAQKLYS